MGVIAFACPTIESGGHAAGFASNCASVHAFCSVVSLEGSCFGRSTLTLMLACVPCAALG